jgi:hypothetical protein
MSIIARARLGIGFNDFGEGNKQRPTNDGRDPSGILIGSNLSIDTGTIFGRRAI